MDGRIADGLRRPAGHAGPAGSPARRGGAAGRRCGLSLAGRRGVDRFWIPLVVFALLCVVFGVALKRAPEKQFVKSALLDKPAPDFVLPDLLKPGSTVDSRQFRGRWVLINVWGTWCFECRAEHEQLL